MTRRQLHAELLAAAACIALIGGPASAQSTNFSAGKTHWLAKRYVQAMPPLKLSRNEPSGRNAEVDYMLGTSGCRIATQRQWGARVLNYALYSYPLTGASRATITAERDRCLRTGAIAPVSAASLMTVSSAIVAGATARGKLFNFGDNSIAAYPARRTRDLDRAELASRAVPLGQAEAAERMLHRLAPDAKVYITGRYAIATESGQSEDEARRMAAQLDRYVTFLSREYGFSLPDRYITLYLVPDIGNVQAIADKVHGLDVSPSTLGYSFQDDLSAVGVIRGTQAGTLMHELFHLLVRASFGDIPQWLDEGVASLYEVSAERGDRYVGLPNWRGRVLGNAWDLRPSLQTVISSPWFAFDRTDGQEHGWMMEGERAAVHLATARYLVLYLQDKGRLRAVFNAFRTRDPGSADDPGEQAVAIVEDRIGPMAQAQGAYDEWLRQAVKRDDTNIPNTGKSLPAPNAANAPAKAE